MEFKLIGYHTPKSVKGIGLCETCRFAHIMRGPSGHITVTCGAPLIFGRAEGGKEITFKVEECNQYSDNRLTTEYAFQQNGWLLLDDGHGHKKFVPPAPSKD